jgi:outer membrane protein OmpA-like peptidoglycan-associated protein
MNRSQFHKPHWVGLQIAIALCLLGSIALADTVKAQGVIKGRSGSTLIVQTPDSPNLLVMLTDGTEVGEVKGLFKARRKEMSMAALIPGLAIQIEGTYDANNQLVAKVIKFSGDDLKRAHAIQAGMAETSAQTQKNKEEIAKDQQRLDEQRAALQAQAEALKKQEAQVAEQQQKIAANKAAIEAAVARFGQLDDYYILDELTILFANGKSNIDPMYPPQLLQLGDKAKGIQGYMIELKGYASTSGSAGKNQKLSEDRVDNVANFLRQQARVPLTNMLAPAAMGESEQIADEKTPEGQAKNRRVVVRVLQNKGVAGPLTNN